MPHRLIVEQAAFEDLCVHIRDAGCVAFDTEFISEFTYRPELCLLQFATPQRAAAVDPLLVTNLQSWWQIMAEGQVEVVVHGGREEVRFCMRYAGVRPGRLVDVQVAEGLKSRSFPLSYTALVSRVLGRRTHGKETRTDWRRRPLTDRQLIYALEDVQHILEIWQGQKNVLGPRGRIPWAEAEFCRMVDDIEHEQVRENWRRLPGIQSLSSRELGVVREVFTWREQEAAARDRPARKVLRDDLIIELARRQPGDVADLLATRDMNRTDYRKAAPAILESIASGVQLADSDLPEVRRNDKEQDEQIVAQLLSIALANRCAQAEVAMGLVGTSADLKHLARWHIYGDHSGGQPRLTQGWRGEVCGALLTDVLDGKISVRVSDPKSDHPLEFESRPRE